MPATHNESHAYLPDFCAASTLFVILLVSELVAIVLSIATGSEDFLTTLSKISFFTIWLALLGSAMLCVLRRHLERLGTMRALIASFFLLVGLCLALAELAFVISERLTPVPIIQLEHGDFLFRVFAISAIVVALAMRYLYVSSEWRRSIVLEAQARVSALQALIRPHFLFNSMNTIASLTRSNPRQAEEAVEDLSDLLRANLAADKSRTSLKQELEIAAIYQRIEKLRLGDRLKVRWDVDDLPMRALIPGLTIQPLLENAIYHGIELLPEGGEVVVEGRKSGETLTIRVSNPVAKGRSRSKEGNRMAMSNIRQRFDIAYGGKAKVDVDDSNGQFTVSLSFPLEGHDA